MNAGIIFGQMLVLLTMMVTGYVLYRIHWIDDRFYPMLSRITVNIFNPLLAVYGVLGKSTKGSGSLIFQNLLMTAGYFLFLFLFGFVINLILRPKKENRSIYRIMTMFSNVGFMGIPVITSVYGDGAILYIVFYMLGYNLLMYTYGLYLSRKAARDAGALSGEQEEKGNSSRREDWKRMINPGVVISALAIVIFALDLPVPDPVITLCDYMGNCAIPLSMILIGASIARMNLRKIFTNFRIYGFLLIRMVALPILLILLLRNVGLDPVIFGVFAIEMAMPVGSVTALIVAENGADSGICTDGVMLSTVISVVTIPLVCLFLT